MWWIFLNAPWFTLVSSIYYAFTTNLTTTYEDSFPWVCGVFQIDWLFIIGHTYFLQSEFSRKRISNSTNYFFGAKTFWVANWKIFKNKHPKRFYFAARRDILRNLVLLAEACNFTKSNTLPWGFSRILNCAKVTKSRKSSHILCV